MTKQTKMLLGIAIAGGVGYWLYTKYGKKSTSSNFAGFVGGDSVYWNAGGLSVFSQPRTTMSTPTTYNTTLNVEGCKKLNPNCACYDRACEKCKCPQPNVEPFYYITPNPQVHP